MAGKSGFPFMSDLVSDLRTYSANPLQRIPTGLISLDLITEGPAEGEVFTILGRSYSGKSLMATNIMASNQDKGCIFFSLEMPARQALTRLYATWSGMSHRDVQDQVKRNALPQNLGVMAEELDAHVIIDRSGLTLGDMSLYLKAYADWYDARPDFVVIDYLELIGGGKQSGEGWIRTEAIAGALKDWAKSERMPVFVLHQTNRTEKEYDPPTADSARGAGFTESDAVIGMWQPWRNPNLGEIEREQLRDEVHFNVLKNRITGRMTANPIRTLLRDDLRFVDLSAPKEGR